MFYIMVRFWVSVFNQFLVSSVRFLVFFYLLLLCFIVWSVSAPVIHFMSGLVCVFKFWVFLNPLSVFIRYCWVVLFCVLSALVTWVFFLLKDLLHLDPDFHHFACNQCWQWYIFIIIVESFKGKRVAFIIHFYINVSIFMRMHFWQC